MLTEKKKKYTHSRAHANTHRAGSQHSVSDYLPACLSPCWFIHHPQTPSMVMRQKENKKKSAKHVSWTQHFFRCLITICNRPPSIPTIHRHCISLLLCTPPKTNEYYISISPSAMASRCFVVLAFLPPPFRFLPARPSVGSTTGVAVPEACLSSKWPSPVAYR